MTSEEIRSLAKRAAQNCKLNKSVITLHKCEKSKVDTKVPVLSITGIANKRIKKTDTIVTDNVDIWVKEAYPVDGWVLESYFYAERYTIATHKIACYYRYFFVLTSAGDIKVLHVLEKNISDKSRYSCTVKWYDADYEPADDSDYFANSIYYLDWDNISLKEHEYKECIAYWNYYCSRKYEDNTGKGIYQKLVELLPKNAEAEKGVKKTTDIAKGKSKDYSDDDLARIFD